MGILKHAARGILFAGLAFTISAQAAQPEMESGSSDASIKAPAESAGLNVRGFNFSGKSYLGGGATFAPEAATSYNQWFQLIASGRHVNSGLGLSAMGIFVRSSVEEQVGSTMGNPVFTVNKLWEGEEGWFSKLTLGVSGVLPGNENVRLGTAFSYAMGPYAEWVKEFGRFTVTELLSYSHGTYLNTGFEPAVRPEVLKSATTVDFNLTEKFYLEAVLQLFGVQDYSGLRDGRYNWSAGMGYEFNKTFSADAGFGTCYGAGQPNGHYDQLDYDGTAPKLVFADLGISI